jgi:hypothetical protein
VAAPRWGAESVIKPARIENSAWALHRIAALGIVEILQLLALKIAMDWRSAVSANFQNSERARLEHEPVDSAKNPALLVELRPLEHASMPIRIDEDFIDRSEVT